MSKQFRFYAVKEDLEISLNTVASELKLKFADAWIHGSKDIPIYNCLTDWNGLGINTTGRTTGAGFFLIVTASTTLTHKTIRMDDGSTRFKYDPIRNPSSIVLQPSGVFKSQEREVLIVGMCGTALTNLESENLYRNFRKLFLHSYTKLDNGAYLGPQANDLVASDQVTLA